MLPQKLKYSAAKGTRAFILVMALLIIMLPLLLMIMTSLKTESEVFANPLALPEQAVLDSYARAWNVGDIPSRVVNSVIVTVSSVALATITGAGAGYVGARIRPRRLGNIVTAVFALGLFLPVQSALVPLFSQMITLGLLGTLMPMILVDAALQLPLTVVIFTAFFAGIPEEIEEAAFIDGAGRWRALTTIVLPLAKPAVATSVILGTISVWNDFFIALIFGTDTTVQLLPVGLTAFQALHATDWPATLAYSSLLALPMLFLYMFLQRYVTDGVAAGAVRG